MPPAKCIGAKKLGGFSATTGVMFNETFWVLEATAYDSTSQAKTTVTQGIRMRTHTREC